MPFDQTFANIAAGFSALAGGPYHDATAAWEGEPEMDDGGDIETPGAPSSTACKVQVTVPNEDMRADADFLETDVGLRVLAAGFTGTLNTEAKITIASGPHAGTYEIRSCGRDTAAIGWLARGRKG